MTIENDLLQLLTNAVSSSTGCMAAKRRAETPRGETGKLQESVSVTAEGRNGGSIDVLFEQDESVAPHGPIINNPSGGRIEAQNAEALGPFQFAGQNMFRRSVRQSVEHKGWWDEFAFVNEFEACVRPKL